MSSYLVTGCSRGLGLELAKQLSKEPSIGAVIATCRSISSAQELPELSKSAPEKVRVYELDITSEDDCKALAEKLGAELPSGLDCIINNAGVNREMSSVFEIPSSEFTRMFNTNALGVHHVTAAMLPLLKKGTSKKIINISSQLGSIGLAQGYPFAAYSVSKCAQNFLSKHYSLELAKEGFAVLSIDPGYLQTEMGGPHATDPVDKAAGAIIEIIQNSGANENGAFIQAATGQRLAW